MPVILPPGRLKLAISPALTGSAPLTKTIGIVDVAAFAASPAAGPPAGRLSPADVLAHLRHLSQDFELEIAGSRGEPAYRLGRFKAFLGQHDHVRHQRFAVGRAAIS